VLGVLVKAALALLEYGNKMLKDCRHEVGKAYTKAYLNLTTVAVWRTHLATTLEVMGSLLSLGSIDEICFSN